MNSNDTTVKAAENIEAVNRIVVEVAAEGSPNMMYIPISLLG